MLWRRLNQDSPICGPAAARQGRSSCARAFVVTHKWKITSDYIPLEQGSVTLLTRPFHETRWSHVSNNGGREKRKGGQGEERRGKGEENQVIEAERYE